MYDKITKLIQEEGDKLLNKSGKIVDIGTKKKWLTESDIEIERKLTKLIESFEGEHLIFAEEEHTTFPEAENIWIIDPISHTNNFLAGLPHYAVVISHMKKGEIIFAAIYDPSMKELFIAKKGEGTFLNGKKVSVSKRAQGNSTILYQPYYYNRSGELYDVLYPYGFVKSIGSMGLHYAYVACGRVEAAITITKDMFPEFAGKLMVEEAGGKFTQFDGKNIDLSSPSILASNLEVYGELSDKLKIF